MTWKFYYRDGSLKTTDTVNEFYETIKRAGVTQEQRASLNFIEGSNITITITDDASNNETDVTIASTSSGSGHTLKDDGTPLTQRAGANFIDGEGVDFILTDDSGNDETEITAKLDINGLASTVTVDENTDYFVIYDADVATHRKVLGANLPGGTGPAGDSYTRRLFLGA